MKLDTIQTSFAYGEIGDPLYGRSDTAQYAIACKIVENFLVRPYGSLITTPGTEFVNECKTGGSTGIVRIIPFVFSRVDSYIIEIGVGYFRFFTNGSVVTSSGTIYEVAHTYAEDEIEDIHYCQLNDILWITHKDHPTRRLIRSGASSWELEDFNILAGPFLDDNADPSITIKPSGVTGTINLTVSPTNANIFIPSGATTGHDGVYWKIGTALTSSTTGLDVQGYVKITKVVNSFTATASVIKTLVSTASTSVWAEGAFSLVNGYPARCTFHKQRLVVARTDQEPNKVWMSKVFIFDDFGVNGGEDEDAINIQLASGEGNEIKWLASGKSLLAGTYGGDFVIKSGDDSPLTPENTSASKHTDVGTEAIIPKKIGSYLYAVQRFATKLREIFFFWDIDTYKSVDKTMFSPHIAGKGFKDMAYQLNPDTVLWCITSSGTLATFTREVDQEVQGWARSSTDGTYESIACIPSQSENHDEVWVVVKRTINGNDVRYIERFKSQIIPDRQDDCFYVHSGLSYSAYSNTSSTTISLSATAGTSVVVTSSSAYFQSNDVGQRIRAINSYGNTVGELKVTGYTSSTIVVGQVKKVFDASAYAATRWGVSVSSISGLGHLEGKTVSVLADGGNDKPNKVVSSGTITLSYNYFKVITGLPYTQRFETLPQEKASQRGTAQGKKQRINNIALKVNRSYKGFLVGSGNGTLSKFSFRDPSTDLGTPESLYSGILPNITFNSGYEYGATVRIENSDPLPIELLSIITTLDTQDN